MADLAQIFGLTITNADGAQTVARFSDQQGLADRQLALQRELELSDGPGRTGGIDEAQFARQPSG